MAEEAARRVALPRLRAAWLRELGVEVLWPVGLQPLRQPDPLVEPNGQDMSEADDESSVVATAVSAPPQLRSESESEFESGPMLEHGVLSSPDDAAGVAVERVEASSHEGLAMLQCRLYASEASPGQARWIVVTDAAELHASREGPAKFLDALMRAVIPGGQASIAAIPVPEAEAIGWLAADEAFARLAMPGTRLILIGIAARRAAGMATRLGEIGRLQVGAAQLPAVALPLLSDLTASQVGKADAWRVLRALDSAGS